MSTLIQFGRPDDESMGGALVVAQVEDAREVVRVLHANGYLTNLRGVSERTDVAK